MRIDPGVPPLQRLAFGAFFSADWFLGSGRAARLLPRRWNDLHRRMTAALPPDANGTVYEVERRRDLTPEEFRERYLLTGIPVVLERAAAEWPAVRKWTPEHLLLTCRQDRVEVLDGQNWTVNTRDGSEVVSTSARATNVEDLLQNVARGGAWYGAFMELLDTYKGLRDDLDLSFVAKFGHTNPRIPWHTNILAKMYVGGPNTATSLHCAGISNLFVQVYGRKKWVLIPPKFTPFMYPAPTRGINWQSRVDFRNPDYAACPLYRYVDRYETVLEPGDVLWNPPFVWHGVMNLTESIAVSLWWTNLTRALRNNPLLSALTLCGRPNPIALQLGLGPKPSEKQSGFRVHLNK
jgi:hypothetical protein